jgi:hypothetical protein
LNDASATFDALRSGIASGQLIDVLDDLLPRLTQAAAETTRSNFARLRREVLLHRSTVALVGQRRRDGTSSTADEQQVRRVIAATLELIDAIERQAGDSPIWRKPPALPPLAAPAGVASGPAQAAASESEPAEDIFVSYKREDSSRVEPLVGILRAQGWRVFWDPQILPGAANWDMLLERKLKGAKCIVVAWSKLAAESEFVRTEAHYGRDRKILVPVTIDGVVPATFALSQTVDLSGWAGSRDDARIAKLLQGVGRLLGA